MSWTRYIYQHHFSCVRCCHVSHGMGLDFSTCDSGSDNDRRAYIIGVGQRKMKKIIVKIDEWLKEKN